MNVQTFLKQVSILFDAQYSLTHARRPFLSPCDRVVRPFLVSSRISPCTGDRAPLGAVEKEAIAWILVDVSEVVISSQQNGAEFADQVSRAVTGENTQKGNA